MSLSFKASLFFQIVNELSYLQVTERIELPTNLKTHTVLTIRYRYQRQNTLLIKANEQKFLNTLISHCFMRRLA